MKALMQVLESTMEARDPYTVAHQRRVSQIAYTIGKEMRLSEDRLSDLRMAGSLHDLGKFALPSDLLSKPGKLTHPEFALIKTHPQVAYNILNPITLPGNTAEIILQHHERMDGSGYPQGLKGEEVLLEARILGVADVLEAMCSHRPYRAARGLAETLDEITSNRGTLYDAAVVDTCLNLFGQGLLVTQEIYSDRTPSVVERLAPTGNSTQSQEMLPGVRALPPAVPSKKQSWISFVAKGHRSWMHIGSASIMAWLIMASIRGF
jgi:HD-GYP domain-containing protein (c-di-GMP phosphodiesterase class II)